jgi:hypothetical protein
MEYFSSLLEASEGDALHAAFQPGPLVLPVTGQHCGEPDGKIGRNHRPKMDGKTQANAARLLDMNVAGAIIFLKMLLNSERSFMIKSISGFLRVKAPFVYGVVILLMLFASKKSYLRTTGFIYGTLFGSLSDNDGNPLPWMNSNIIQFLQSRLNKSIRLFEYGSGFSTTFYALRVKEVISVEHDLAWHSRIAGIIPGNAKILLKPLSKVEEYCESIKADGRPFDVIVIDGRERMRCISAAIQFLSASGVIILDDSERERYALAFDIMRDQGFKSLDFIGLKPGGFWPVQTTIFYRNNNVLGI